MSVALAILSYPAGSAAVQRHWKFFQNQKADRIYGIGTVDGLCKWPEELKCIRNIGEDRYIEGPHLPNRLLATIRAMLLEPWSTLILCEPDTLFLKPIPAEKVVTVAGFHAGGVTWGSKAKCFVHNPWCFSRDCAIRFLMAGQVAIDDGLCPDRLPHGASTPECSPDVFLAAVCEMNSIPMQFDLWREYSRNDLSSFPEHLPEARQAYLDGYEIIHGCKHEHELSFILS